MTYVLFAILALAGAPEAFELRAEVVRGHILQIQVVARGSSPVLVVPRARLGCEVQVEVLDVAGVLIGHLGPRAQCPPPGAADFQAFVATEELGTPLFGTELDLSTAHRFRIGEAEEDVVLGRDYRLVVAYESGDADTLAPEVKSALHHRHPGVPTPVLRLRSEPIPYRRKP